MLEGSLDGAVRLGFCAIAGVTFHILKRVLKMILQMLYLCIHLSQLDKLYEVLPRDISPQLRLNILMVLV